MLQKSLLPQQRLEHLWHSKNATKPSKNILQHTEDSSLDKCKSHKKRLNWVQMSMESQTWLEVAQMHACYESMGTLGGAIHPFPLSGCSPEGHNQRFSLFTFLFFLTAFFSMVGKVESRSDDHSSNSIAMSTHMNFSYLSTLRTLNDSYYLSSSSSAAIGEVSPRHAKKFLHHDTEPIDKTTKDVSKKNPDIRPGQNDGISQNTRRLMNEPSELSIVDWYELFRKQEVGILQYLEMIRPMGAVNAVVYQYPEPSIWPAVSDLLRAVQQDRIRFMNYFSQWLGRSKVSKKSLMSSVEQKFFDQAVDKIFNLCLLNMDKATPEEVSQFKKQVDPSVMSDLVHYLVHRFPKKFSIGEFRHLEQEKRGDTPRYRS